MIKQSYSQLDDNALEQTELTHTVWSTIKILGVYFDYHNPSRMKANFLSIFKSLKKTLNIWRNRGLTLLRYSKIYEQSSINHNS